MLWILDVGLLQQRPDSLLHQGGGSALVIVIRLDAVQLGVIDQAKGWANVKH